MIKLSTKAFEPLNQWIKVGMMIRHLRLVVYGLLISNFLMVCVSVYLLNRDTLVVALTGSEKLYFVGSRQSVEVSDDDVIEASRKFVLERYQWKDYSVESLVRNVSPFVTYGLLKQMTKQFEKSKDFVKKNSISQDIIVQEVKAKEDHIEVKIDRVVSVGKKVKAVQPLEVHLEVVQDTPNKWNLKGLYINSITEFEQ
jgi:hypothetical protein